MILSSKKIPHASLEAKLPCYMKSISDKMRLRTTYAFIINGVQCAVFFHKSSYKMKKMKRTAPAATFLLSSCVLQSIRIRIFILMSRLASSQMSLSLHLLHWSHLPFAPVLFLLLLLWSKYRSLMIYLFIYLPHIFNDRLVSSHGWGECFFFREIILWLGKLGLALWHVKKYFVADTLSWVVLAP